MHLTPKAILALPQFAGHPVPFMTAYEDGAPVFDQRNPERIEHCFALDFCPLCGNPVGAHPTVWLQGMAEIVNRLSSLPPMHTLCAIWGAVHGRFHPAGDPVTLEKHQHLRYLHRNATPESDTGPGSPGGDFIHLPSPPQVLTWWQHGEALHDPAVIHALIDAYELEAIDIAENADERSGLNLNLARVRQFLVPASAPESPFPRD